MNIPPKGMQAEMLVIIIIIFLIGCNDFSKIIANLYHAGYNERTFVLNILLQNFNLLYKHKVELIIGNNGKQSGNFSLLH